MLTRLWHSLRVEDALLFGWLVLVQPLISELGSGDEFASLSPEDDPLVGLVYLVAAAGAPVALATRSPGEGAFEFESARSPRSYAVMPFMAALSLIASVGAENAGIASYDSRPIGDITVLKGRYELSMGVSVAGGDADFETAKELAAKVVDRLP